MSDPVLLVAPSGFGSAAERIGDEVADLVRLACVDLLDGLADCGGMAGSDPAGAAWGSAYDDIASQVVGAADDLVNSCYRVGTLLEQTGLNYAAADAVSARGPAPGPAVRWSGRHASSGRAPSAVGAGVSAPNGWSLVAHLVGYVWPDGHQDRLHHAAADWRLFASQLSGVADYVDRAAADVQAQQVPESDAATTVLTMLRSRSAQLVGAARSAAAACDDYAHHIDTAHHELIEQLAELIVTTAAIEAAGAATAVLTAGVSEAAAQTEVAFAVQRVANTVRAIIVDVVATCRAGAAALGDLMPDVVGMRAEFAGVLARDTRVAEVTRPSPMLSSRIPREERFAGSGGVAPQTAALDRFRTAAEAPDHWNEPSQLLQHFLDHRADFGCTTPNEYAERANAFLVKAVRERLPMIKGKGTIRFYDPRSNTFGAYTMSGRTRTFFKPSEGYAYWLTQLRKYG